ncbi:hypothetical protein QAD02_004870 [Eretmocerus hayati]|uniref:Uncharacterized protein n=1 Tax=Eretmocerus hayati TaxID=131215 RepID=A0ACC2NRY9_9HYME|nr:hypothetical protein QAD02_004870 [Eretmocerus hayati]
MSENQSHACAAGDSTVSKKDLPEENAKTPRVCQIAEPAAGDNSLSIKRDNNANTKEFAEANGNGSHAVSQLQEDLLARTSERDELRRKLEEAERKLTDLSKLTSPITTTSSITSSGQQLGDESRLRRELEDLRASLSQTRLQLDERERRVANQDNQISALSKQVNSLKEVVAITKDMLSIRNMEVKHLQQDVDKMEGKIGEERARHSAMLDKMDAAVRLNADLKREYQSQLKLFQELRGQYEQKVSLLSEENKALETAMQAQPAQ